ncbi:hypothetical protein [Streptomyces sp. NPDC008139]|uniref:hypothetical protein n=1 Tax=Streptomyces sp. NPDC008139 TaxID=3364814 RepID=UPI0036E78365
MNPEVRALLEAVLEAIDIPSPATVGDGPAFSRLLEDRVLDAVLALRAALAEPISDAIGVAWNTAYLRKQLASKPPTTYTHYQAPTGGERR